MNDTAAPKLDNTPLSTLHRHKARLAIEIAAAKATMDIIDAEIARRYGTHVRSAYINAGKEHGTVNLPLEDGWALKASITKRVKYDSTVLMDVAAKMDWGKARTVFKIELSVPEKMYSSLAGLDPELKKAIDVGRTVETGEPKIELVPPAE
jgi:hypothetical protein